VFRVAFPLPSVHTGWRRLCLYSTIYRRVVVCAIVKFGFFQQNTLQRQKKDFKRSQSNFGSRKKGLEDGECTFKNNYTTSNLHEKRGKRNCHFLNPNFEYDMPAPSKSFAIGECRSSK
jgi:uncharacterized protein with von Willebrand factor type A (vWA) domain